MHATAQKQGVVFFHEGFGKLFDGLVQGRSLFNQVGQLAQLFQDFFNLVVGQTFLTAQGQYQHQQARQLGGEGLGGGHTDLRTRLGEEYQLGFTYQGGTVHVAYRQATHVVG